MPSRPGLPTEPNETPRRYLIAAGTSCYDLLHEDDQLPLVDAEVQRIVGLLTRLGYQRVLPELGRNPQANSLRLGLSSWCRAPDRHADDVVVIYYSGHGGIEGGRHYLLTTDSRMDNLYGTALAAEGIGLSLVGSKLREVMVILDTCWAGSGAADLQRIAAQLAETRKAGEQVGAGLWFVAAARAKDPAESSVFVDELVRSIDVAEPGRLQRYLDPLWLVHMINSELEQRRRQQRASCNVSDSSRLPRFLPNPRFDPDAVPETDVEAQRLAASRRLENERARYSKDVLEHFGPRSRGVEFEAEPGFYFTGREQVLRELVAWLAFPPGDRRARVVTGEPGSGKSAVLARLVTLADPEYRGRIPLQGVTPDTIPPPGSIDVAIHARRRRLEEIVAAIGTRAGIMTEDAGELLAKLAATRQPLVVVVDALDEAGSSGESEPREARRIARTLLRPLGALPNVRLLVGTRRPLLTALGPSQVVLDLDTAPYLQQEDVAEYARQLLRAEGDPDRTTPYQSEDSLTRTVAKAIAARAHPCFLVARIVAQTLASAVEPVDIDAPGWQEFPEEVGQAFDDYLARFGHQESRVRRLLAPLAYAEGLGLPRDDLWPALVTALSGEPCSDDDIGWLLDKAGAYIIETTEHDRSVYRLYHQALTDHLRDRRRETYRQHQITEALITHVPTYIDRAAKDWFRAPPYIRTYIAAHASVGGILDDFLLDPMFLVAAAPQPLLRAAQAAATPAALAARSAYQQVGASLTEGTLSERIAHLQLAARYVGADELAERITSQCQTPWQACWAHWRAVAHRRLPVAQHAVVAVATAEVDDRPVVVCGGTDGMVSVWDLESATLMAEPFYAHDLGVLAVAVAELEGRPVVISGGGDRMVRVWDLESGQPAGKPFIGHEGWVYAVAVAEVDDRPVVVSGGGSTVRVWELESGLPIGKPFEDKGSLSAVHAMAVAQVSERQVVVVGSNDGSVWVWDLETREMLGPPGGDVSKWVGTINTVALGEMNGQLEVIAGGDDGIVRLWNWESWYRESDAPIWASPFRGEEYWTGGLEDGVAGQESEISELDDVTADQEPRTNAVSGLLMAEVDGRSVVVAGDGPTVRMWELESGWQEDTFVGHGGRVRAVAVAEVGGRRVVVSGSEDGTVRTWELESLWPQGERPPGHEQAVNAVAVAEVGGRRVVVSGSEDGTVRTWELESGRRIGEAYRDEEAWPGAINAVAAAMLDDQPVAIAAGDDGMVQVWQLSGRPVGAAFLSEEVWIGAVNALAVADMASGPVVVSGGDDGMIRAWDLESGEPVSEPYLGHDRRVLAVAVAEVDGRPVVVSGGDDGMIRAWDLESGEPVSEPYLGHDRRVLAVAVAEVDGRPVVVSGGDDGMIRVWDLAGNKRTTINTGSTVFSIAAAKSRIVVATALGIVAIDLILASDLA
jgi:WD40 repeat protein